MLVVVVVVVVVVVIASVKGLMSLRFNTGTNQAKSAVFTA